MTGPRYKGGSLISKIHQVSGRIFARILQEEGIGEINPAQGRILFALWDEDNIPITTLSRKTLLERSTLTGMLDRLERDGLVVRVPSPEDRRVLLVRRTEKDRRFQKKYLEVSERMCDLFYRGFTDEEILRFERDLERVLANCVAEEESHG